MSVYGDGKKTGPGNFGLVALDMPGSNDTGNFDNWITQGPTQGDFTGTNPHGSAGTSVLPFPTSTSAATWDGGPGFHDKINSSVQDIIGEVRLVPIYSATSGSGDGMTYTITGFGAVTVLAWTGSGSKSGTLTIQPAVITLPVTSGMSYSSGSPASNGTVYGPMKLTQIKDNW
jgi:hypothetical protein